MLFTTHDDDARKEGESCPLKERERGGGVTQTKKGQKRSQKGITERVFSFVLKIFCLGFCYYLGFSRVGFERRKIGLDFCDGKLL